jgi:hypothetical protein
MRIRQSELRRLWQRKKEAYKLRLKTEGVSRAAAPKAAAVVAEAKPKAAPRKKKTEEKTEE